MSLDLQRLRRGYAVARDALLAERNAQGHWTGELSTSALSTATAVMALEMVRRQPASGGRQPAENDLLQSLIDNGLCWLAEHQNADGGWGDTTKSISNISTSMLCRAAFHATGTGLAESGSLNTAYDNVVQNAVAYIDRTGGVDAVLKRYGKDRTFSIPILTHCALAGLVDWKHVLPLPFYLACLPHRFYKTVRLPVVSYALPALIAIGQVGFHFHKPWNPISRLIKRLAIGPSLRVLERIQPENGGFLEATPLTSFVTMSLAGVGRADHPVARKGLRFIIDSVRPDGSWPIDTNLATWVTTMSVAALGDDLPEPDRPAIREWLLNQQYKEVHPYTNAGPGGWAWTDLPGGVPDADDTPGAMLALMRLASRERKRPEESGGRSQGAEVSNQKSDSNGPPESVNSVLRPQYQVLSTQYKAPESIPPPDSPLTECLTNAVRWLLDLQNRDGGFPTFCRGWGKLPFDRSSPDITAHCLRAIRSWFEVEFGIEPAPGLKLGWTLPDQASWQSHRAISDGFQFLQESQHPDGSWHQLWFGNQHALDDANPLYGTARVLAAYRDCNRFGTEPARRGLEWIVANQNDDGGWGGVKGVRSTVEETALATEILLSADPTGDRSRRGVAWLLDRIDDGSFREPAHIGFYFAKLWYFEKLYPLSLMVAALRRAVGVVSGCAPEDGAVSQRLVDAAGEESGKPEAQPATDRSRTD